MDTTKRIIIFGLAIFFIIVMTRIHINLINEKKEEIAKARSTRDFISQEEKDFYNAKIKRYVDDAYTNDRIEGSKVKSMIDDIISMNQENVGENRKFIGIITEGIDDFNGGELKEACEKASIYSSNNIEDITEGENNAENVSDASSKMMKLKSKIDPEKKYNIDSLMSEGMYSWITIKEIKN